MCGNPLAQERFPTRLIAMQYVVHGGRYQKCVVVRLRRRTGEHAQHLIVVVAGLLMKGQELQRARQPAKVEQRIVSDTDRLSELQGSAKPPSGAMVRA